jgi:hypothetical protein
MVVDVRGGGKSSRGERCLKRGKRNRKSQPHGELPRGWNSHRYFLSGFNEHVRQFVDPSDRSELAACTSNGFRCVRIEVCAGRNNVLVNLAAFDLSLLKCTQETVEKVLLVGEHPLARIV